MIRSPRASTRRSLVAALLLPVLPATAQVLPGPAAVNIQGRLTQPNGAAVPDGPHAITVSLWDAASGGNQKFSETLSAVNVSNGLFNARLTTLTPGKLNGNLWVQWKVDGDAAMTPRIPLGSVATALKANTVPDGSIGSAQLALDATSLAQVSGNALRASTSGNIGIGTTASGERVTLDGRLAFARVAGDQIDAGKLDYRGFDTGALSIVGAGAAAGNRAVRLYDRLSIGYATPTSGAAVFNGAVGIGTATPGAILDVQAADAPGFTQPAALFSGSSAGGTWLKLHNTAAGGHQYAIVATGPGNSEGAGNLLFYDHTALALRMILTGSGDVGIGTKTPSSELDVNGEVTAKIVTVTGGSDVAEPYTVASFNGVSPAPGMVVSIAKGQIGKMIVSGQAYDKRVAGILSGANGIAPGITLRHKGTVADGEMPVASIGRVWAWCDADAGGPIEEGDMLTTSTTPGHAMKAADRGRSEGAVIGKAMSTLSSGKGLVLVLVTLN